MTREVYGSLNACLYVIMYVFVLTILTIVVLLDQGIQLDPAVSWVKANAGQTGLYRVNYDVSDWIQFVTMLRNDHTVSVCTFILALHKSTLSYV